MCFSINIDKTSSIFKTLDKTHSFESDKSENLISIKTRYYKTPKNSEGFLKELILTLNKENQLKNEKDASPILIKVDSEYYMWRKKPDEEFVLTPIKFNNSDKDLVDRWITQKYQQKFSLRIPYKNNTKDIETTIMFTPFEQAHQFDKRDYNFYKDTIIYNLYLESEDNYIGRVASDMRKYIQESHFNEKYNRFRQKYHKTIEKYQQDMQNSESLNQKKLNPLPGLSPDPHQPVLNHSTHNMKQNLNSPDVQINIPTNTTDKKLITPLSQSDKKTFKIMPDSPIISNGNQEIVKGPIIIKQTVNTPNQFIQNTSIS